jgi:hypothetical protein
MFVCIYLLKSILVRINQFECIWQQYIYLYINIIVSFITSGSSIISYFMFYHTHTRFTESSLYSFQGVTVWSYFTLIIFLFIIFNNCVNYQFLYYILLMFINASISGLNALVLLCVASVLLNCYISVNLH